MIKKYIIQILLLICLIASIYYLNKPVENFSIDKQQYEPVDNLCPEPLIPVKKWPFLKKWLINPFDINADRYEYVDGKLKSIDIDNCIKYPPPPESVYGSQYDRLITDKSLIFTGLKSEALDATNIPRIISKYVYPYVPENGDILLVNPNTKPWDRHPINSIPRNLKPKYDNVFYYELDNDLYMNSFYETFRMPCCTIPDKYIDNSSNWSSILEANQSSDITEAGYNVFIKYIHDALNTSEYFILKEDPKYTKKIQVVHDIFVNYKKHSVEPYTILLHCEVLLYRENKYNGKHIAIRGVVSNNAHNPLITYPSVNSSSPSTNISSPTRSPIAAGIKELFTSFSPANKGPAPSPAKKGPAPSSSVRGPAPSPAKKGPSPSSSVRGPAPSSSVRGPAPSSSVRGPTPSSSVRGRAFSPSTKGHVSSPGAKGPISSPGAKGPASSPGAAGQTSLSDNSETISQCDQNAVQFSQQSSDGKWTFYIIEAELVGDVPEDMILLFPVVPSTKYDVNQLNVGNSENYASDYAGILPNTSNGLIYNGFGDIDTNSTLEIEKIHLQNYVSNQNKITQTTNKLLQLSPKQGELYLRQIDPDTRNAALSALPSSVSSLILLSMDSNTQKESLQGMDQTKAIAALYLITNPTQMPNIIN